MPKGRKTLKKQAESIPLNAAGIDTLSELLTQSLAQLETERREAVRLRLAVEDVLALWMAHGREDAPCTFRCGTRLGRSYIELSYPGERIDPAELGDEESGGLLYSNLLAQTGLTPVYAYQDGVNRLSLSIQPPLKIRPLFLSLIAVVVATAVGLLFLAAPQSVQTAAADIVTPLFDAMMGVMQTVAPVMIFLCICSGVVSIGDMQSFGRLGRSVLGRFLISVFVIVSIAAMLTVWFFHPQVSADGMQGGFIEQLYAVILRFLPSDPITPFINCDGLQIIFMAVCVGLAILALGDKVEAVRRFVEQAAQVVKLLMGIISRCVPLYVLLGLLSLFLSGSLASVAGVAKSAVLVAAVCVLCPLVYTLVASVRVKVPFSLLLRKIFPLYWTALTTGMSASTFTSNIETCQQRLGVSGRIAKFAVPLGQMTFMPGTGMGFLILALGLSELYGVALPVSRVVIAVLLSALFSVTTPPLPGSGLACYTMILTQLGIPSEANSLAVAANVVLFYFMYACGIASLQSELLLAANRLGMVDRELLECTEKNAKSAAKVG